MSSAKTKIEIRRLKRRARQLYVRIYERQSSASCGNALLGYISPQHAEEERELQTILIKLKRIDPAFPEVKR